MPGRHATGKCPRTRRSPPSVRVRRGSGVRSTRKKVARQELFASRGPPCGSHRHRAGAQARDQAGIARAAFFPSIGYEATARRSKGIAAFLGISNSTIAGHASDLYLGALQEVSSSLVALDQLAGAEASLTRAVAALQRAVDIALDRYLYGRSSYLEVLDAEERLFPAENAQAEVRLNRLLAYVQLYKTLGGGWSLTDAQWSGEAPTR